jgi:uncharacterized FlaG/YvyC family protein
MVEQSAALDSVGAIGAAGDLSLNDAPAAAAPAARRPTAQQLQDAVKQVNDRLSSVSRVLELNVDAISGLTVATVKDSRTGAVLQQFPGADSLHLAQMLAEWAGGKHALLDLIA